MSQYVKNEQKGILKKQTKQTKDESRWVDFKTASNEVNNSIQYVKCKFLSANLAAIQKRYPNNELSSCQHTKKVIDDKLVLCLKWWRPYTSISQTLVRNWQEKCLLLILCQKIILSQETQLSLLNVAAPMKSENYLKNWKLRKRLNQIICYPRA